MKRNKKVNAKLNILMSDTTPKALLIGLRGLNFSNRIESKYTIFRKSGRMPALIFLKLFGASIVNKITNINRMESINNYFRLHLNFYLKMVSQLNQLSHQSRKLHYSANYSKTELRESGMLSFFKEAFRFHKNVAANFSLRKFMRGEILGNPRVVEKFIQDKRRLVGLHHFTQHIQTNNFMQLKTEHGAQRGVNRMAMANGQGQNVAYSSLRSTGDGLWSAVGGQRTVIRHAPYAISHMPSESLYFHNQRNKIEQEVEDIRRVVVETKEAVEEKKHHSPKDMSMAIKQHLDINRISDQVYQNIERRIRIERERRGM